MVKAVIFDMDGVIVDSEPIHNEAEKKSLSKYELDITTEEMESYTGATAKFMYEDLIRKYNIDTTFEKIFDEKEEILYRLFEGNLFPIKGILELIKGIKEKKIKLGLASSSHRKFINFILEKLEFKDFFETVVGAEDITYSKPNPEIFLKSTMLLNVKPNECVVIEDAKLGVEAAKNAGMKCIGYRNLNSGNQDLSKADQIIDDFSKLKISELVQ